MQNEPTKPKDEPTTSEQDNVRDLRSRNSTQARPRASIPPRLSGGAKRLGRLPAKGFARNPLLGLPRNEPCPCRSGKKFKVCCLRTLPEVVPEVVAAQHRQQMSRPDLVFMTQENQASLQAEIAERRARCNHKWESIKSPAVGANPEVIHIVCEYCMIDKVTWDQAMQSMKSAEAEPPCAVP